MPSRSSPLLLPLLLLLLQGPPTAQAYHVSSVATLLDEDNFLPHIQRVIDSQNHRTVFVRFFLHGEGDQTHSSWEHVARSPHRVHGATFADVDCSESVELRESHRAGSEGWPMIKYFNWHTGIKGGVWHPPSHATDHDFRMFVLRVVRDAHRQSREKHHAHLQALHSPDAEHTWDTGRQAKREDL